jgi:hypothetical protein
MTDLDDLRLRVVPGDGVVLRLPGVTAVVFPDGDQHDDLVMSFFDAVGTSVGQPDAGRTLTRTVAGLVAAADDVPPLGLVVEDGEGVAVLLHGDVELTTADETLSGRDASTCLDRLLPALPDQWSLARDGAGPADEWSYLVAGVVRGDGIATGAPAPIPAAFAGDDQPDLAPADTPPPPPSEDVPLPAPVPAPDFVAVSLLDIELDDDDEDQRQPLPLAVQPPAAEPEGPKVHGVLCARGHLNDPRSPFCATCGISMVQQTHNLVEGPRPPLGVLVLDDGSTYVVDRDLVIGREPGNDPAVADGTAQGIALPDPERSISRVHARINLVEWEAQLVDAGSANGTFVAGRQATAWTPVPADVPTVLTPGMHVLVGSRVLSFDTHRRG